MGPATLCVRFSKFCTENGLSVYQTEELPVPHPVATDVLVMDIEKFAPRDDEKTFSNNCDVVCSEVYDIFIDDFQVRA